MGIKFTFTRYSSQSTKILGDHDPRRNCRQLRCALSPHREARVLFRRSDMGDHAAVELKKIRLDSVAEDDASAGHERFHDQLLPGVNHAGDDRGPRMFAQERLANDERKAWIFPV